MEAIVQLVKEEEQSAQSTQVMASTKQYTWVSIDRRGYKGKFVPDNELPDFEGRLSEKGRTDFETWLRETTTIVIDTEVDIQLGEFTIKRHTICPLDPEFTQMKDYKTVFADITTKDTVQCAEVMNSTNRRWVRLVGLGFDLQLWAPDTRTPRHSFSLPYETCNCEWLKTILDPIRPTVLLNMKLFVSSGNLNSAGMAILCGCIVTEGESIEDNILSKEIVVYRYPRVVHIFNIVEHGRRFYRTLVFSSSAYVCLHDFKSETLLIRDHILQCMGNPTTLSKRNKSLVIIRDRTSDNVVRVQHFVPHRLLIGLMPQCLLNTYNFWQNDDDSLTGYMPVNVNNAKNQTRSLLTVKIVKDPNTNDSTGNGEALANSIISRTYLVDDNKTAVNVFDTTIDSTKPVMYLVNLLAVVASYGNKMNKSSSEIFSEFSEFEGEDMTMHALVRLLLRLDSMANIVAWSKSDPSAATSTSGVSIDLIELPRLRLTFEKFIQSDNSVKYICAEQSGLCLYTGSVGASPSSGTISSLTDVEQLILGLPHAVLLTNMEQELFVLLAATVKPKLVKNKSDNFNYHLVLSPSDQEWIENAGESTYFIYPIHISTCFLSSKSVASTLYLLLFRLIMRNYKEAFKLTRSCVIDRSMSPQEKQFYEAIGILTDSFYPDAYACRLRLFFASYGCRDVMPYLSSLEEDMHSYISKREIISSYCRLTPTEEAFVMSQIPPGAEGIHYAGMANRELLIRASFDVSFGTASKKSLSKKVVVIYPKQLEGRSFLEDPCDMDVLDISKPANKTSLGKISLKYSRPDDCSGPEAITYLCQLVEDGIDIRGKGGSLGFMFLYDLMTNNLPIKILPDESAHGTGCMLFRLLIDDSVAANYPQAWTILKIMAEHPNFATSMPIFEDKRKLKLPSFGGDIFQNHIKSVCSYILAHLSEVTIDRLGCKTPNLYVSPKSVPVQPTLEDDRSSVSGRDWLTPIISDFNKSKLILNCKLPNFMNSLEKFMTSPDIASLVTVPLNIIGLQNYVEMKSLAGRNLPPIITESNFDVLNHPSSRSHIARLSYSRLQQDISDYAKDENAASAPVLKAFQDTEDQLSTVALETMTQKMMELGGMLKRLKEKDTNFMKAAISEISNFANSKLVLDSKQIKLQKIQTGHISASLLSRELLIRAGKETHLVRIYYTCY